MVSTRAVYRRKVSVPKNPSAEESFSTARHASPSSAPGRAQIFAAAVCRPAWALIELAAATRLLPITPHFKTPRPNKNSFSAAILPSQIHHTRGRSGYSRVIPGKLQDVDGAVASARAPVAQWIEQPPPKGQVARSIRVRGA